MIMSWVLYRDGPRRLGKGGVAYSPVGIDSDFDHGVYCNDLELGRRVSGPFRLLRLSIRHVGSVCRAGARGSYTSLDRRCRSLGSVRIRSFWILRRGRPKD